MVARQPLPGDLRKLPALVQIRVVDQHVPAVKNVTKLIDIEAVALEIGEQRGLVRREARGRLDQAAPVTTVTGGQLYQQAHPSTDAFGLLLIGLGGFCGHAHQPAWHLVRLLLAKSVRVCRMLPALLTRRLKLSPTEAVAAL
jgi:hypothetical protein